MATITVNDLGPAFVLSTIPPVYANVGQTFALPPVAFNDPGFSNTHTAVIDWGDGTTDDATVTEESSDGSTSGTITDSHVYTSVAPDDSPYYTATITLTDQNGVPTTEMFDVYVVSAVVTLNSFTTDGNELRCLVFGLRRRRPLPSTLTSTRRRTVRRPMNLLMSFAVNGANSPLTTGTYTASFPAAFDDIPSDYHLIAVTDASSDPTQNTVEFGGGIFVAASATLDPQQNFVYVFVVLGVDTVSITASSVQLADSTSTTSLPLGGITDLGGIHVRGEDGDEVLHVDAGVTSPLWLYGGATTEILSARAGQT